MLRCRIEWLDPGDLMPTPDDNEAVGVAWKEAYVEDDKWYPPSRIFPICAQHARMGAPPHWQIRLFK